MLSSPAIPSVHVFVMARGQGHRLFPLTKNICKPAVPFGTSNRIIDFTLANVHNANLKQCSVLTPYKALTLQNHLRKHWSNVGTIQQSSPTVVGNALSILDALEKNLDNHSDIIGILPSDHISQFDLAETLKQHLLQKSKASILCMKMPSNRCGSFGILRRKNHKVNEFIEKPNNIPTRFKEGTDCWINIGIYWFSRELLIQILRQDAHNADSHHDFGHNIIPLLTTQYLPTAIEVDHQQAWRDVGTIKSYWDTHWNTSFQTISQWNVPQTLKGEQIDEVYTMSTIPTSTHVSQCIIHENVKVGERCHIQKTIIGSNSIIDRDITLHPKSTIIGEVKIAEECLIIPSSTHIRKRMDGTLICAPL